MSITIFRKYLSNIAELLAITNILLVTAAGPKGAALRRSPQSPLDLDQSPAAF
jgi:hypothetical protein